MEFSIVKEEGDSAFERFMEKDSSLQNIGANPKVDPTLPVPWEHAKRSGHTNAYTERVKRTSCTLCVCTRQVRFRHNNHIFRGMKRA